MRSHARTPTVRFRIEHSLGVSHLASSLTSTLYTNPASSAAALIDSQRHLSHARALTEVAALVHELGHGPFSHLFDHNYIPLALPPGSPYMHHEDRSCAPFRRCVNEASLDWDAAALHTLCDMIRGRQCKRW